MDYTISLFENKQDVRPKVKVITWADMIRKATTPVVRANKDGWLMCGATFGPDPDTGKPHRRKELATESSLLCGDIDHGATFEECAEIIASHLECASVIYTTHSHQQVTDKNPSAEDRLRIVIPLASSVPADRYPLLWQWANAQLGARLDRACKDISRMYYTPAICRPDAPYLFQSFDGDPLDWQALDLSKFAPKKYIPAPFELPTDGWEDLKRELIDRIRAHETAHQNHSGKIDCRGVCHNGKGKTALFADPAQNTVTCTVGCKLGDILRAFGLPTKPQRKNVYTRLERHGLSRPVVIPAIKG